MAKARLRWARSATKHRIGKAQVRFVIEHAGIRFRVSGAERRGDDRLLYLGDDQNGTPLEVMAVELESGELLVIHSMRLRAKYVAQYGEAITWRV